MGKVLERLGRQRSSPRRRHGEHSVPVPEYLKWLVWRLVLEHVATLREIETYYDLLDVLDANEALDIKEEAERRATEAMTRSAKGR